MIAAVAVGYIGVTSYVDEKVAGVKAKFEEASMTDKVASVRRGNLRFSCKDRVTGAEYKISPGTVEEMETTLNDTSCGLEVFHLK